MKEEHREDAKRIGRNILNLTIQPIPENADFISNSGIFSCSEIGKCSRNVAK